jgi:hypothetical protein
MKRQTQIKEGSGSHRQTRKMTLVELESKAGIKAQHAAANFIIAYLKTLETGWTGEETQVGSHEDREGIDFWLVNRREGRKILVDFSFKSKDGYAVRLDPIWFETQANGSFKFREEYAQSLIRAFLPAMQPDFQVRYK